MTKYGTWETEEKNIQTDEQIQETDEREKNEVNQKKIKRSAEDRREMRK